MLLLTLGVPSVADSRVGWLSGPGYDKVVGNMDMGYSNKKLYGHLMSVP